LFTAAIGGETERKANIYFIALENERNRYKHLSISKEAVVLVIRPPAFAGPFEPAGRDKHTYFSQDILLRIHASMWCPKPRRCVKRLCLSKMHPSNINFLNDLQEVREMRENRLFFDSSKGRKMAALSMSEKTWPN